MGRIMMVCALVAVAIVFGAGTAFAATWQKTTDGSSVVFDNNVGSSNTERLRVAQ